MTKIPPDDILESLYKLRPRESDQLKTVLELYGMDLHQKRSMPNYQKLKTMEHKSETSITKFSTPEMTELKQVQWLRVAGD